MSPGQTVSVGAVICQEQGSFGHIWIQFLLWLTSHKRNNTPSGAGFPNVSIVEMRSCDGEDPPASYFDSPQKKDHLLVSFDKAHKPRSKPTPKQTAAASKPKKPTFAATPSADADVAGAEEEEEDDDDDDDDEDAEGTEEEDGVPASTLKKPYCTTKEGADGLKARWCLERQPYVWVEPKHHRRIVRTRAEITNLQPNVSLCGIKVELEANKSAINTWPDWWPESDEDDPLDPGNSFGAS